MEDENVNQESTEEEGSGSGVENMEQKVKESEEQGFVGNKPEDYEPRENFTVEGQANRTPGPGEPQGTADENRPGEGEPAAESGGAHDEEPTAPEGEGE